MGVTGRAVAGPAERRWAGGCGQDAKGAAGVMLPGGRLWGCQLACAHLKCSAHGSAPSSTVGSGQVAEGGRLCICLVHLHKGWRLPRCGWDVMADL